MTLRGKVLHQPTGEATTSRALTSLAEYRDALHRHFDIELNDREIEQLWQRVTVRHRELFDEG